MTRELSLYTFFRRMLNQKSIIFICTILGISIGIIVFFFINDKNVVSSSFQIKKSELSLLEFNNKKLKNITKSIINSTQFKNHYIKDIQKKIPLINSKKLTVSINNELSIFKDSNDLLIIIYKSPFPNTISLEILKNFYPTFNSYSKKMSLYKSSAPFYIINKPYIVYKSSKKLIILIIILGITGFLIGILICSSRIKYNYDL